MSHANGAASTNASLIVKRLTMIYVKSHCKHTCKYGHLSVCLSFKQLYSKCRV